MGEMEISAILMKSEKGVKPKLESNQSMVVSPVDTQIGHEKRNSTDTTKAIGMVISMLTVDDVFDFLISHGMVEFASIFKAASINGEMLLHLDMEDLVDLGVGK